MEISLIKIGNSKGIRLPKVLIEKYNLADSIELLLEKDFIILKPIKSARKDWEKSFKQMHENGDDQPLLPDFFNDEDLGEWK